MGVRCYAGQWFGDWWPMRLRIGVVTGKTAVTIGDMVDFLLLFFKLGGWRCCFACCSAPFCSSIWQVMGWRLFEHFALRSCSCCCSNVSVTDVGTFWFSIGQCGVACALRMRFVFDVACGCWMFSGRPIIVCKIVC